MRFKPRGVSGDSTRIDPIHRRSRILRRFLAANSELLELMADLETDLNHLEPGESHIRQPILRLLEGSLLLAENLNLLTRDRHKALYDAQRTIEKEVRGYLSAAAPSADRPLVIPLDKASSGKVRDVGGKAARLGELRVVMSEIVPPGFVISTSAYRLFLERNNLHEQIRGLLKDLSFITERDLFRERTATVRSLVEASPVPREVAEAIANGIMQFPLPWPSHWAVRSSAVGEDGRLSFAGQFDSFLNVPRDELQDAYRKVIASRYADRAVLYRLAGGFTEVDTPMAVLFMPMLDAQSAGVLYTRDPADESADLMLINSVHGLADQLVQGRALADIFVASRSQPWKVVDQQLATRPKMLTTTVEDGGDRTAPSESCDGPSLCGEDLRLLVEIGLKIERRFGRPQDIEWVLTKEGRLMVVQARPLRTEHRPVHGGQSVEVRNALMEGGVTIFPGRTVGPAYVARTSEQLAEAPERAILVVEDATPEIGAAVPFLAGLISERGNPGGHAATLAREFGVPSLFGVEGAIDLLQTGQVLSIDATHRKVFEGALWPEVEERVEVRMRRARTGESVGPLHDWLLTLNLTDPLSVSFRASKCRSVHDIIRFAHEKVVAAVFDLGDEAVTRGQKAVRLDSKVPLGLTVMDLGGAFPKTDKPRRSLTPEEIDSRPFQALWRGIADPAVSWAGRSRVSVSGFASVMVKSVTDPYGSIRQLGERNYLIVSPEYLNLNARLAYHFAMVDAFVCEVPENNYVNFRFRGGAASAERRDLRARFLAEVLLNSKFGVNRRGDLVTGWLRRHSRNESEEGLALLGRLMACARQLDMLMDNKGALDRCVERFLEGNYQEFA
ncbi:MAG: pyruvate, water dikinase [Candidatus Latescibacterota bacterium]|nr:MAG: pyruvate, water dikinase [Candidatus Latescibacterota bacterium]